MALPFEEHGDGPPLVLLHYLGGQRDAWRPVVGELAARHRCFLLDLPGFGEAPPLAVRPTVDALADAVAATIAELRLGRPATAGVSLGGGVALALAARGVAGRVVAISPLGFQTRREAAYARASLRATHAAARALGGVAEPLARSAILRTLFGAQTFGRAWRVPPSEYAAIVRHVAAAPGMVPTLDATNGWRLDDRVSTSVPVTLLWGTRDALLLPRQGRRAARRIPHARLVPLPGCGHVPFYDDPEAVAAAIVRALEE